MEKRDAVFFTSERCSAFVLNQPSSGHRTSSPHLHCLVQFVCLINRTWFYWPKGAQRISSLKGRMLVCLYGIKRADVILNSW